MKQPESRGAVLAAAYARLRRIVLANRDVNRITVDALSEVIGEREYRVYVVAEPVGGGAKTEGAVPT